MPISTNELVTLLRGMADNKYKVDAHVLGHAADAIEELAAALEPFALCYETRLGGADGEGTVFENLNVGDFKKAAQLTGSR